MNREELRFAFVVVWIVVSLALFGAAVTPFLIPESVLTNVLPPCEWQVRYGKACFLCGTVRAFYDISRGEINQAFAQNARAPFLYAGFLLNDILLVVLLVQRCELLSLPKTERQGGANSCRF